MNYDQIVLPYDAAFDWDSERDSITPLWEYLGKPERMIETACGPARLLAILVNQGVYGVGIDISEPMLALAQEHLETSDGNYELHLVSMEEFELNEPCGGAFCSVGSFGHLSTRQTAGAHLSKMHAALTPGSSYAIQMRLQPIRVTGPSVPDEHNSWEFELQGDTLRYTWYGTGIDPKVMQEVQRSRFEWLTGPLKGKVIETDHLMAIWDWDSWQEIVTASGFKHIASVDTSEDFRELELGPNLYGNPYAWHILRR
jgi:SAM-dependent methyltransferase